MRKTRSDSVVTKQLLDSIPDFDCGDCAFNYLQENHPLMAKLGAIEMQRIAGRLGLEGAPPRVLKTLVSESAILFTKVFWVISTGMESLWEGNARFHPRELITSDQIGRAAAWRRRACDIRVVGALEPHLLVFAEAEIETVVGIMALDGAPDYLLRDFRRQLRHLCAKVFRVFRTSVEHAMEEFFPSLEAEADPEEDLPAESEEPEESESMECEVEDEYEEEE